MTDSAPPRLAYTPPAVKTYTPESWQARLVADIEAERHGKHTACVTVILDDGPVRWAIGGRLRTARTIAVLPKA